jgi:hypothetical protein
MPEVVGIFLSTELWHERCLAHLTSARVGHVCSLSFRGLQAFFKGDVVSTKNPRKRTPAGSNPSLEQPASVSFKVRSGRSAMSANIRSACASNGDTLPPRGFGAALRLSFQRCSHLTDERTIAARTGST